MRNILDWPDEVWGLFAGIGLTALFVALSGGVAALAGRGDLALASVKAFGALWAATLIAAACVGGVERAFRLSVYRGAAALVGMHIAVAGTLLTGWSAVAAGAVTGGWATAALGSATLPSAVIAFVAGLASCYVALSVVGALFRGTFVALANVGVAAGTYVLFVLVPGFARAVFGPVLAWIGV